MNQNTIVIILVSVGVLLLFSFLGASKAKKEGFNNNNSSDKPSKYELIYNQEFYTTTEPKEYIKNKTDEDTLREVYQKVIKYIEAQIAKIDTEPKQSLKEFISDFPEFKDEPESEQIKQMKRISADILTKQKEAIAKLEKRTPGKVYYYSLAFGTPYTIEEMKESDNKIEQEIRKNKEMFDKELEREKYNKKKYDREREKYDKEKYEKEREKYLKDKYERENDKYKKSYDNYDHFSKTSTPTTFYGPNGTKAVVMNKNDKFEIIITESNGKTKTYSTSKSNGNNSNNSQKTNDPQNKNAGSAESISRMMKQFENSTFYGPDGGSARFFTGKDGQNAVEETKANGDTTIYTSTNTYTFNYNDKNKAYDNSGSSKSKSDTLEYSNDKKGGQNKTSASEVSKGDIPHGKEDLYILKSQIVPPVCPVCPTAAMCADKIKAKCPPCPACARCPESNFDCKKVPSYYSSSESRNPYSSYGRGGGGFDATGSFNGSSSNMPVPVMSDFSTFGM